MNDEWWIVGKACLLFVRYAHWSSGFWVALRAGLHVILHESHSLARYVARAHLRAPLACASQFKDGVAWREMEMCPFRAGYKISATSGKIHAVLHMLRRCVGFSWAKPLCYEKINASPCVHSVIPHAGSLFWCFSCFLWLKSNVKLKKAYIQKEKGLYWNWIIAFLILKKANIAEEYGTIY